jgi:predicted metal-dependent enzyme (double-stranded beta helix superfamily)
MISNLNINEGFHPALKKFICDVHEIVHEYNEEETITKEVSSLLQSLLKVEGFLNREYTKSNPLKDVDYLVYTAPDNSFSILSAVWDVGQSTPIHDHGTWGVIGVVQGVEIETHYHKPTNDKEEPLKLKDVYILSKGEVLTCCTKDDDVHDVRSGHVGEPCVGFHVYGGNIKEIQRHLYDPITGKRTVWDE